MMAGGSFVLTEAGIVTVNHARLQLFARLYDEEGAPTPASPSSPGA